jgi:hypothetical protein
MELSKKYSAAFGVLKNIPGLCKKAGGLHLAASAAK